MNVVKTSLLLITTLFLAGSLLSAQAETSVIDLYEQTQAPNVSQGSGSSTEIVMQLDQLQAAVRELRGELELQKHELQQLQQHQARDFQDIDSRLQQLGMNGTSTANTVQSFSTLTNTTPVRNNLTSPVTATAVNVNMTPQADEVAYQKAYLAVQQQHYSLAAKQLQDFLKQYSKSRFVANAHYWLGELYALSGDTDQAILEFNTIMRYFPHHPKASDAMLKVGYLYCDKALWPKAYKTLTQVQNSYPKSAAAKLANQRLQQLSREGRI